MATPGRGHKAKLYFARETVWGSWTDAAVPVDVTPNPEYTLEIISSSINPELGMIEDPSLNDAVSRRNLYRGGQLARGSIVLRGNYEGLEELFYAATGTYSYDVGVHTFTEGALPPSLCLWIKAGGAQKSNADAYFKYRGAVVTGLTLRATAGTGADAMLQAEFQFICRSAEIVGAPSLSSLVTAALPMPMLFHTATVSDSSGSAVVRTRSFEFKLENQMAEDRFYFGSENIDRPIRNNFLNTSMQLTQEFYDSNSFDNGIGFTDCAVSATFLEDKAVPSGTGLVISIPGAKLQSWSTPVEGYGILITTVNYIGYYDTGISSSYELVLTSEAVELDQYVEV
jgi:hypothetical protein